MAKIVHIRADGTVTNSIDGVVITSKEFYAVINNIQEKRRVKRGAR